MKEVTEQLWWAGKYAAVGIVVLATLPLSIPSLVVLSVLLLTFVLPLLCAVAGFQYLRKHATMLYRYLPGYASHRSSGADPSRRRLPPSSRSGGFTFLELLRKDADSIDIFEAVDQEFDAVVVSAVRKLHKVTPETSPRPDVVQQFETREEEVSVPQRDEAARRWTTTADNPSEFPEFRRENAHRDERHGDRLAGGALRRDGRQERENDGHEEGEEDSYNAREMTALAAVAASELSSGAVRSEGQFVGTVPSKSTAHNLHDVEEENAHNMARNTDNRVLTAEKGQDTGEYLGAQSTVYIDSSKADDGNYEKRSKSDIEASFREREMKSGVDLIASCTKSGEGVGDVQGIEKRDPSNLTDREVNEDELATVSENNMDLTSEDSCAVHPEVETAERDESGLNRMSSSGASSRESVPLDFASFRPQEPVSDHESFESTSDASLEAPQSGKETDSEDEEDHHSPRSRSLRGMESFDADSDHDDSSSSHESVQTEALQRVYRGGGDIAQAPATVLRGDKLSSSPERISGFLSATSRESEASEEKAGLLKNSRSASAFSEDMYDSDEQLHLQQFWRGKEFQACTPVDHAKAQNQHRFRFLRRPQVLEEEERQLRAELKAIRIIVGDEAPSGPLVSDIDELSQILGIELPSMTDDIPELEWAKVAVEVMKVVVGVE